MHGRTEIPALHADQLRQYLIDKGLVDSFDAGTLICATCGRPLNAAGISAIRQRSGRLIFACGAIDCLDSLTSPMDHANGRHH
jgi:hypothetical protein